MILVIVLLALAAITIPFAARATNGDVPVVRTCACTRWTLPGEIELHIDMMVHEQDRCYPDLERI